MQRHYDDQATAVKNATEIITSANIPTSDIGQKNDGSSEGNAEKKDYIMKEDEKKRSQEIESRSFLPPLGGEVSR